VASVSWDRQGFGLTSAVRYLPSYDDVDLLGGGNDRRIAAQAIVDAQLSLDLGKALGEQSPWNGFEIRAGAFNLFDAEPPFAEAFGMLGYDNTQADLRQRFAYVKIAKRF
jgi:outer membrane receptor protein involved in Fe transport